MIIFESLFDPSSSESRFFEAAEGPSLKSFYEQLLRQYFFAKKLQSQITAIRGKLQKPLL